MIVAFFQISPAPSLHNCSLQAQINLKVCFKEKNQSYLPFAGGLPDRCFAWGHPGGLSFHPHSSARAYGIPFHFLFVLLLKKEKIK